MRVAHDEPRAAPWLHVPVAPPEVTVLVASSGLVPAFRAALERHYNLLICRTPLDVIQALLMDGHRISFAVLDSRVTWLEGLQEFLHDEYPDIEQILVSSAR